MIVNYSGEVNFLGELDIDNIGEFALECNNDEQYFWYYVVRTSLGMTSIAYTGPIAPDVELLPNNFKQGRFIIPFNEGKILRDVSAFLNDKDKKITQARVIEIDDAISEFINLRDYLAAYNEEFN